MDCSWLVEDDYDNEEGGSESDGEEAQTEVEARLYSIVHHSDLSQPLPPELAKHYSIKCEEDGRLTVALNDTLEDIRSEETRKVDNLMKDSEPNGEAPEVIELDSSPDKNDAITVSNNLFNSNQSSMKKFRYSDTNLDSELSLNGIHKVSSGIDYSDLNYFKITESFLNMKKMKKLKNLVIPPLFQTGGSPDWKDSANESFISVGANTSGSEHDIIDQMVCALKKANPHEAKGKLYFLAKALFVYNRKKYRKLLKRKQTRLNLVNRTLESLEVEKESLVKELNESFVDKIDDRNNIVQKKSNESSANHVHGKKNDDIILNGCVTLNISPFKPALPTIDLVSEEEIDHQTESSEENNSKKWKSLYKCELPTKWTKKMIKFYTKPSKRKMEMNLDDILEDLKRRTTIDDWRLDVRDQRGIYQRTPTIGGKHRNRRCPNCRQFGHLMRDCPSPRKIPTCSLCGLNYHTDYSCPNKICLKCGVPSDAYECMTCYYKTFNYDTPCGLCGQLTHRTEICPDLWRSFHATVDGDKKIPKQVKENKRKYCCNCASKGHFSHKCPFSPLEGEHISSFVTNYSASQAESGTTEIVIPHQLSHIIESSDADRFLQSLSNSTNALIDVEEGPDFIFRISGTFEQCSKVKSEIEEYVNTRKRKRNEPYHKKKKRKIR